MNSIVRKSAARAVFVGCSHLVLLLSSISSSATTIQNCGSAQAIPDRYIVRAQASTGLRTESLTLLDQLVLENPARLIHKTLTPTASASGSLAQASVDKSVVTVASELTPQQLSALVSDFGTLSIEQDCIVHVEALPNDPTPAQYTFVRDSLNLARAWNIRTDASSVIVAISDTGVDYKHPDLAANIWTNKAELNGVAQVDDDGNGCIDDIHGCDFGDQDGDPMPFASSEGDHGTHVSGIIGAVGNNSVGTVGVAWSATLMAVKGFNSVGTARVSDLLNTVYYSVNNGARVINCSWGADRAPTQAETDAFQYAISNGALPVVAAGNAGEDAANFSPAAIDGVLTVGSVNSHDQVSGFSNYGPHVLVYAPGGDAISAGGASDEFIYSTLPTAHASYGTMRGTSMAAPFVTGIAALVFAVNPKLSAPDVRNIIVTSSRHVSSRIPDGTTTTIAIPDAEAALVMASTYTPTVITPAPLPSTKPANSVSAAKPTEGAAAYDASGGCSMKHERTTPPWPAVLSLLAPLMMILIMKRRLANAR